MSKKTKETTETEVNETPEVENVKDTYLEDLKRVQAEFENYMKRVEKERNQVEDFAKMELLLKILHTHDSFEAALKSIRDCEDKEEIIRGVEMIFSQMQKMLEEEEVKPIKALGEKIDPYKHDVIAKADGGGEIIVEEVKKGWMFKDKLLRASIVKVGGGKDE